MTLSSTPPTNRPRSSRNASGAKILITAASLAAVVGGWATFTLQAADPGSADPSEQADLDLPPLPTLIPEPQNLQAAVGVPLAAPVSAPGALPAANPLPAVNPLAPNATPLPGIPGVTAPKGSGGPDTPAKPSKPKAQKPKSNGNTRSSK